jgi:hypothetical protein
MIPVSLGMSIVWVKKVVRILGYGSRGVVKPYAAEIYGKRLARMSYCW